VATDWIVGDETARRLRSFHKLHFSRAFPLVLGANCPITARYGRGAREREKVLYTLPPPSVRSVCVCVCVRAGYVRAYMRTVVV
jgi:hypothetical protein